MLSIVIPVRNDPHNLRKCLSALATSTHSEREVIVVDDASTDGTGDVARAAGAHVIRQDRNTGPAGARNLGVGEAHGEVIVFVDADVCVHAETLARMAAAFAADPGLSALFGSYDTTPGSPAFFAQYKNLFHHFVHQQGAEKASTFWTGCGAIRRAAFLEMGGFDTTRYSRPCIEDIELGARLVRAGHRIALQKDVQATHLKRWTLWSMLKSDVWDRGVPWTELILREKNLPNDLNLRASQRLCAVIAYALFAGFAISSWFAPSLLLVPILVALALLVLDAWTARGHRAVLPAALGLVLAGVAGAIAVRALGPWSLLALALVAVVVAFNWPFYRFFARVRHPLFALAVVPLHLFYYLYSGVALGLGTAMFLWKSRLPPRAPASAAVSPEGKQVP